MIKVLVLLMSAFIAPVSSQRSVARPALTLDPYVKADGAITVFANGSYVEPYFAMRALNTAADLGADVDSLARGYIAWQLQRLDADSAFKRYCLADDSTWMSCGAPDADDAAVALWIELLYRTAGKRRMPAEWKRSADQSRHALARLLDSSAKVYRVSASVPVALFMDNVEVLSALETSAATGAAAVAGDHRPLSRGASRLRSAIKRQFWDVTNRRYRVSSQEGDAQERFYPEIAAQVFPAVFGFGNPVQSPQTLAGQWLRDHERDWIAESDSGAAWGLIAVAAARTGHRDAVRRWLERADRVKAGAHWNVADEAIYRTVSARALSEANGDQRIR